MKKLLFIALLFLSTTQSFADLLLRSDPVGGGDRLEALAKALSNGHYADDSDSVNSGNGKSASVNIKIGKPASSNHDWEYYCNKDRFNGSKSCYLARSDLVVLVLNGRVSVFVGNKNYPRSSSAIKIDNNKTIYGYEGMSQSPNSVVAQLKSGRVAYTRFKRWPYEYNVDGEVDLTGFTQSFNNMMSWYKRL